MARLAVPHLASGVRVVDRSLTHLPSPPDDDEKYWYFGPQHRWLLLLQAISFALIGISVLRFSLSDMRLLLFLVPMTLYAVGLVISLLSSTRRRRINRVDHEARIATWAPAHYPTVDVFLPTAGEDLDILTNTYLYVAEMQWPAVLRVYVLDDAGRPEVADLARFFNFEYLARPDRGRLKKAGNLRYGFEHSDGDVIAVFDADFVPRADYLHELVPYLDDPEVGIVQSPQFFDSLPSMGWLQRCAGATQELFYRWVQPGRDRAKAAICVGTCALYRRAALLKSGGFAQIGHSEDVHTGVNMMKVGHFVQYVPVLVAKGICPSSMPAFLNQQYRWATGSMSLLVDQQFHNAKNISLRQRLCFWSGFLYYISTGLNAFIAPLPALVMLYIHPTNVHPKNSIWLAGALILWFIVLPRIYHGRWRIDVLRVQTMYSFAHAVAIAHVLTGRTRDWIATGAATVPTKTTRVTPLATTISRVMKTYIGFTLLAIWVGLAIGTARHGIGEFWVMILLAALASYVQVPILVERGATVVKLPINAPEQRAAQPSTTQVPVTLLPDTHRGGADDAPHDVAPPPKLFRPDIQGMRAIAVLLIVLYHASVPHIGGGFVGVDVFFVISGFLITSQLLREVDRTGRVPFLSFYAGRARRLLPPAAVVVVLTLVAARIYDSIFNVKAITTDALFSAVYALNYRLAAEGVDYQHAGDAVSPLQHLWSLAVEEQFYVFWPLIVMACVLVGRRRRWQVLTVATTILVATSIYLSITVTVSNPPYAYFSVHTRAWQLAGGALLAIAGGRLVRLPTWFAVPASWVGLALVVGSGLVFNDSTPFPGKAALAPVIGAMLLIAAGAGNHRFAADRMLALRPLQGLGKVSYSWYLWHWPMVVLIPIIAGYPFGWQYKVEIMALALWFAILTLYLVENPALRSRLRKQVWLPVGLGFGAATALAAVAVAATIPPLVGTGRAAPIALGSSSTEAVQVQLASALSVRVAPANLTPSIDGSQHDLPASSRDGCHANFLNVHQGRCVYGDPSGSHTIVLFGDSHMQQWLPAVDTQAKFLGWKVVAWTKAACPIADLPAEPNSVLGRSYTECPKWRSATEHRIEALKPDVVVMSQSDRLLDNISNTQWADTTVATANTFRQFDIPVAYLLETPYPPGSNPECIANHLDNIGACSFSVATAYAQKTSAFFGRRAAMRAALTKQKIATIDPELFFCTPATGACPAVSGNLMVYRDNSHMSTAYSVYLAPLTAPLFVPRGGSAVSVVAGAAPQPPLTPSPAQQVPTATAAAQQQVNLAVKQFALSVSVAERTTLAAKLKELAKVPGVVVPYQ